MNFESYYYSCSRPFIDSLSPALYNEIADTISKLPKRETQTEVNKDLFWLLTLKGWSYDSISPGTAGPPDDLGIQDINLSTVRNNNHRDLCLTSTTIDAKWRADFAKLYEGKLVQLEAQFGKVESMFKDFCRFKICRYEQRLSLGIEVVMYDPGSYFAHRRAATSGMAYFDIAKKTLPAISIDCPIWLIGIRE